MFAMAVTDGKRIVIALTASMITKKGEIYSSLSET